MEHNQLLRLLFLCVYRQPFFLVGVLVMRTKRIAIVESPSYCM